VELRPRQSFARRPAGVVGASVAAPLMVKNAIGHDERYARLWQSRQAGLSGV
jgi:hypothetical protein